MEEVTTIEEIRDEIIDVGSFEQETEMETA